MARPLTKAELDRLAVDFPSRIGDLKNQPLNTVFNDEQSGRLTDPRKERAEQERQDRIKQKQAELEEFMAAADYREQLEVARAQQIQQAVQLAKVRSEGDRSATITATQLAKNTTTAIWMTSWHVWFYLSFQLPLAIMSLAFIGMHAAVDGSWLLSSAVAVISSLASLVGKDLAAFLPLSIGMALHFLLFGLAFFFLLLTLLVYALRGHRPFGGDRMVGKMLALLACFIGYTTPLLNIFPWIAFYIYVMWRSK